MFSSSYKSLDCIKYTQSQRILLDFQNNDTLFRFSDAKLNRTKDEINIE